MKEAQFTCIVCPKSCAVTVTDRDGELSISGYECKRGMDHARDEYLHPMRMLTATVKIVGGDFPRLGVIGTREVPRDQLLSCLQEVYRVTARAPIAAGDVLIPNIQGTGCDVVAAMSMDKAQ